MVGYPVPDPGNPVPDPGTRFRTRVPGYGTGYPGTRVRVPAGTRVRQRVPGKYTTISKLFMVVFS